MIQEFNGSQTSFDNKNDASIDLAKELLLFGLSRDIKYLFKYLLSELDVLEREGSIDIQSKDFFRKRVLDRGNSCLRNLESELEKFDVSFAGPNQNGLEDRTFSK